MRHLIHQFGKMSVTIALMAAGFLFIANHVGLSIEMRQMDMGPSAACLFMPMDARDCPMTALQHLNGWADRFVANGSSSFAASVLLALIFVGGFLALVATPTNQTDPPDNSVHRRWLANLRLFDPLLFAFSQGILKPKLYA